MIPFLTDNNLTPSGPSPVVLPQPGAGLRDGGAGRDFAGLLPAALDAVTGGADVGSDPAAVPPIALAPAAPVAPVALPPARFPNGMILPEPGTALPDSGGLMPEEAGIVAPPVPPSAAPPATDPPVTDPPATDPALAEALDDQTLASEASPATDSDLTPTPVPAQALSPLAAPLLAQAAALSAPPARLMLNPSALSEKLAKAPLPATLALPVPALAASIEADQPAAPPAPPAPGAMPSEALADALAEVAAPASAAPSSGPASAATAAAPAVSAQLQPVTTPNGVSAPAEARIAPQQDSAIAQVGELREALRAARPEMTLRHAEFGFVSLRVEATGAQDWRAVLASRDPGFVPAIQAALAERAVTASSETSASNTGGNHGSNSGGHSSQGGASEQRYGFSQGSGQGSSQPYMEQSGKRDEGASSQQRQQRSDADEAAHAKGPDAEQHALRNRGLFA